jgi:hypothetical protein
MFFQVFKDDILELPSSLIEKVNDIPGILCDCKSGNTVRNYYYVGTANLFFAPSKIFFTKKDSVGEITLTIECTHRIL